MIINTTVFEEFKISVCHWFHSFNDIGNRSYFGQLNALNLSVKFLFHQLLKKISSEL